MDTPNAAWIDVFDNVRTMLASLGYSVREHWEFDGMCDAVVSDAGADLCRIQFSSGREGGWDIVVRPVEPGSTQTIVRAGERVGSQDRCWTLEEIDHVEALFRTLRVRDGKLHQVEFASDYALRQWVAKASTIMLSRERSPRRPMTEDVVIRPGEAPGRMHPSTGDISRALVQATRLLDGKGFERERALDIAVEAARQDPDSKDAAVAWLSRTARTMLRGRRRDMDLAWDHASHDRVILGLVGPRDDVRAPYEPEPAPAAPGM